jgi:hypothetical protein
MKGHEVETKVMRSNGGRYTKHVVKHGHRRKIRALKEDVKEWRRFSFEMAYLCGILVETSCMCL